MKIEIGKKYRYGYGDGKNRTVKVLKIYKTSDEKIHVKFRNGNWFSGYKSIRGLEEFKGKLNPHIIVEEYNSAI